MSLIKPNRETIFELLHETSKALFLCACLCDQPKLEAILPKAIEKAKSLTQKLSDLCGDDYPELVDTAANLRCVEGREDGDFVCAAFDLISDVTDRLIEKDNEEEISLEHEEYSDECERVLQLYDVYLLYQKYCQTMALMFGRLNDADQWEAVRNQLKNMVVSMSREKRLPDSIKKEFDLLFDGEHTMPEVKEALEDYLFAEIDTINKGADPTDYDLMLFFIGLVEMPGLAAVDFDRQSEVFHLSFAQGYVERAKEILAEIPEVEFHPQADCDDLIVDAWKRAPQTTLYSFKVDLESGEIEKLSGEGDESAIIDEIIDILSLSKENETPQLADINPPKDDSVKELHELIKEAMAPLDLDERLVDLRLEDMHKECERLEQAMKESTKVGKIEERQEEPDKLEKTIFPFVSNSSTPDIPIINDIEFVSQDEDSQECPYVWKDQLLDHADFDVHLKPGPQTDLSELFKLQGMVDTITIYTHKEGGPEEQVASYDREKRRITLNSKIIHEYSRTHPITELLEDLNVTPQSEDVILMEDENMDLYATINDTGIHFTTLGSKVFFGIDEEELDRFCKELEMDEFEGAVKIIDKIDVSHTEDDEPIYHLTFDCGTMVDISEGEVASEEFMHELYALLIQEGEPEEKAALGLLTPRQVKMLESDKDIEDVLSAKKDLDELVSMLKRENDQIYHDLKEAKAEIEYLNDCNKQNEEIIEEQKTALEALASEGVDGFEVSLLQQELDESNLEVFRLIGKNDKLERKVKKQKKQIKQLKKSCEISKPHKGNDPINPNYYKAGSLECIEAMRQYLDVDEMIGFCKGNAFKYIWRAGSKEGNSFDQDMEKARWYLNAADEIASDF